MGWRSEQADPAVERRYWIGFCIFASVLGACALLALLG
jgi:hypothetical protein